MADTAGQLHASNLLPWPAPQDTLPPATRLGLKLLLSLIQTKAGATGATGAWPTKKQSLAPPFSC